MFFEEDIYRGFVNDFNTQLYNLHPEIPFSDYIFLCIGSDKIIGDAYGPLVGEKLQEYFKETYHNIKIIGTLEDPVPASTLSTKVKNIYKSYLNPCIIAIDSALAKKEELGKIYVSNKKMQCGKGINKNILSVGDISIKGVVAIDFKTPKYNFSSLQNTSLRNVLKLANITSNGIYQSIKYR